MKKFGIRNKYACLGKEFFSAKLILKPRSEPKRCKTCKREQILLSTL
jgi:hypothetical protein